MITGCASNKAEGAWQQDRDALQSQLKELGRSQTDLGEKFQTLNNKLSELETLVISYAADQEKRISQNEARQFELEKNIAVLTKPAAVKPRAATTGKNRTRKKAKVEKLPVTTEKQDIPPPAKPPSVTPAETIKHLYVEGYLALKSGHYEQAVTDFNRFLSKYPASKYVHQAHYWLGETLHAQGKTGQAIVALQKAIAAPAYSPKWDAALLRLGQLYKELGHTGHARTTLSRLIREHPQAPEAETARKYLSEFGGNPGR